MTHRILLLTIVGIALVLIAPMSGCYYSDFGYDDYGFDSAYTPGYYDAGPLPPGGVVYYEDRSYRPRYGSPRFYSNAEEGREYREDGRESYGENHRERREDYREGPKRKDRRERGNATGGKEEEDEEEG